MRRESGFTLLEVLISLTIAAVGVALTLSLISGSLGNIRKVRMRTNLVEHAETVMELVLLDENVGEPGALHGDFEDGTRWSVVIGDFVIPEVEAPLDPQRPRLPLKLLSYTVEIFGPGSSSADYRLQTLKLIPAPELGVQTPR